MPYIGIVKDRNGNIVHKTPTMSDRNAAAREAREWLNKPYSGPTPRAPCLPVVSKRTFVL